MKDFKILPPVIDHRTEPTGKKATYKLHPNQHPKSYKGSPNPFRLPAEYYETATYNVHSPAQNAYGDWAAINIGGRYYLFGDFDQAGKHSMSVARFTASSLDKEFKYCGQLGKGHPDPDVGFAEGKFYLFTQQKSDFISPGPWVETVEARVGVDTNNDGKVNQWSKWQTVKETYDYKEGFSKHVEKRLHKLT